MGDAGASALFDQIVDRPTRKGVLLVGITEDESGEEGLVGESEVVAIDLLKKEAGLVVEGGAFVVAAGPEPPVRLRPGAAGSAAGRAGLARFGAPT